MELGLTEADFEKFRRWGKLNTIHLRDLVGRRLNCGHFSATGIEAVALTFLAYCCAVGRNSGTEGELWPIVDAEIGPSLRGQIFANSYPKARVRDATENICSKLKIRHVFGREGEQSWRRSVFLQFGITRSGWNRLPMWLARGATLLPAAIEDLLRPISAVHSDSFGEFWQALQRFRRQQLTVADARKALTQSPWVFASEIEALLIAAVTRPEVDHSENTPEFHRGLSPDRLLGSPILTWHDEPRFELPINSRCRWLTASRYVFVLDNGKRFPLTRHQDEYIVELPHGKLEVDLSEPIVKVDLMRQQSSCLDEPIAIGLAPEGYEFAFYGLNGQMLPYGEERFDSKGGYLICRSTCEVKGEPTDTYTRRVFRGEWTLRAYRTAIPNGLEIHKGGTVLWTNQQQSPRTVNPIEKPQVVCSGGRWGQSAEFTLEWTDNTIPSHLLVYGSRLPLERTSAGKYRGALVLSPSIDYGRLPLRIECESEGRLRWISATLHMGPLNGIAVETEEDWKVFKEAADMDAEYLRSHRVMTQVPTHFNGDQLGIEDWAWMEGDHFCGRPRNTASTIGGTLLALGESLRLSAGPYNRPSGGQRLARSVIHSGVVQWIEEDDDAYQIQLRSTFELGPQHAIWVWHESKIEPEIVAEQDWIQVDDSCLVSLHPGAKPVAFAISFRGVWLGARTCQMGWNGFANLIRATQDWEQTARWLRWWRVPLLHEILKKVVRARVTDSRLTTLRSWTSTEDLQGGARYSEEHEEAWRSVTRRFLWDWIPDGIESAAILTELGLLTGNPALDGDRAWNGYEELLATQPLLLAQAARRGLAALCPGQKFENFRYLLERLLHKILELDGCPSESEIIETLAQARIRAAAAIVVDPNFIVSLFKDAVALLAGATDRDRNLRVAIANRHAVRKYLAAAVIEKMIRGEIE